MAKRLLNGLADEAKRQGWIVSLTGSGHIRLLPPDKRFTAVIASKTTTETRALQNIRTAMKARGFREEGARR